MAGIGFTLRRMLSEEGYGGPLKAFAYAAVVSSGPWLTSSVALALLGFYSALAPESHEHRIFLAIVSYAFAFSLVGVGACQMVASRFLADRLYEGDTSDFAPAFAQLIVPLFAVQALIGFGFLAAVPIDWADRAIAMTLYLAVNGTWLAMVFLSASHDYRAIVWAFLGGLFVSVFAGVEGSARFGLDGQLAGFAAGYVLTFTVLVWRLIVEYGPPRLPTPKLAAYFRTYWPLAVTGLAYNLAIWVDKMLFWWHRGTGEVVAGPLRAASGYDNTMFLAYLTIVPALALFLLKVETDFYDAFKGYFAAIAGKEGLRGIKARKERMIDVLYGSLSTLLKVQVPITAAIVLFAPEIIRALNVSWLSLFVFRAGVFGALLHVLHLIVLIFLLYLDFRLQAMALALVFLVSNATFTWLGFAGGPFAYGFGYAVANAVTLVVGFYLLAQAIADLEYQVFMKQPVS